ncbi:MAG: hypothetical protein JSU87_12045 [Gemmatimonadota bacterium]|nr:MAG: hypothetical protein JSU87_12045 [Gemmatimonadota bacterium]
MSTSSVLSAFAISCAVTLFVAPQLDGQGAQRAEIARLQAENARLEQELSLASGGEFYLRLDPEQKLLTLMYQGAILRDFPVLESAGGRRRILFVERSLPDGLWDSVWQEGQIDPARQFDRKVIDPPESPSEADSLALIIPPTPEEAIPAPDRFLIRYVDGRALEILGHDPSEGDRIRCPRAHKIRCMAARLGRALWPWGEPAVRLRLILLPEQASALYRSLPEHSAFYITRTDG